MPFDACNHCILLSGLFACYTIFICIISSTIHAICDTASDHSSKFLLDSKTTWPWIEVRAGTAIVAINPPVLINLAPINFFDSHRRQITEYFSRFISQLHPFSSCVHQSAHQRGAKSQPNLLEVSKYSFLVDPHLRLYLP